MSKLFENTSRGIVIIKVLDENEVIIIPENDLGIKA